MVQVDALNRRAQQKYAEFVSAMDLVLDTLEGLDRFIERVDDKQVEDGTWSMATREDLQGFRQRAVDELGRLRAKAKKYEAELISRDWRV